jgi:hypothetical protein
MRQMNDRRIEHSRSKNGRIDDIRFKIFQKKIIEVL